MSYDNKNNLNDPYTTPSKTEEETPTQLTSKNLQRYRYKWHALSIILTIAFIGLGLLDYITITLFSTSMVAQSTSTNESSTRHGTTIWIIEDHDNKSISIPTMRFRISSDPLSD